MSLDNVLDINDLEMALVEVRRHSYTEGYNDGVLYVKDKDALGHGSNKRGQSSGGAATASPPEKPSAVQREHRNATGKALSRLQKLGSSFLQTKVGRFLVKAEHKLCIVAHKTRDIAIEVARTKQPPMSEENIKRLNRVLTIGDFVGGFVTGGVAAVAINPGAGKVAAYLPSVSALYVAYSAARHPTKTWAAARAVVGGKKGSHEEVHKAFHIDWSEVHKAHQDGAELAGRIADVVVDDWTEAVFLAAIAEGINPDEALRIVKDAGPQPDGGPESSESDFGYIVKKAMDVVWLSTHSIAVDAEELQYKDTDGAEDGLNDERRAEMHDTDFDPLVVPPIAVWQEPHPDDTPGRKHGQVYVVDGHKRIAHARSKGVPALRGFFIEANNFEEAKRKGEMLNRKMGTKSYDEDDLLYYDDGATIYVKAKRFVEADHPRGGKGTAVGGKFVKKGAGGGAAKGKTPAKKAADKKTMTATVKKGKKLADQDTNNKTTTIKGDYAPYAKGAGKTYLKNNKAIDAVKAKFPVLFDRDKTPSQTKENEKRPRHPLTKKGAYVNKNQYLLLRQKALTKMMYVANDPSQAPTKKEAAEAKARIKEIAKELEKDNPTGQSAANKYRGTLNGNTTNRRERKVTLADEFGDGKTCGCPYCGLVISYSSKFSDMPMEEDKINESAAGGKYKMANLIPSCIPCNRARQDQNAIEFLKGTTYGGTGGTNKSKIHDEPKGKKIVKKAVEEDTDALEVKAINPESGHEEGNSFLQTLSYPEDEDYPFPAHDTEKEVTATAYTGNPWDEEDKDDAPIQVRGTLWIRPSPFGGLQCFVKDGETLHVVDPGTVEPVTEATAPKDDTPPPPAETTDATD